MVLGELLCILVCSRNPARILGSFGFSPHLWPSQVCVGAPKSCMVLPEGLQELQGSPPLPFSAHCHLLVIALPPGLLLSQRAWGWSCLLQDLIRIKVFLLNISVLFLWAKLPQEETGLSVISGGFFETLSSFSVLPCKVTTAHNKHTEIKGSAHLKSCLLTVLSVLEATLHFNALFLNLLRH